MNDKQITPIKIFLFLFLTITVIVPLAFMIMNAGNIGFIEILQSPQFKKGLANSLLAAFCATAISVTLATLLAFSVERTNIKYKTVFVFVLTLPMLIPSISHGMGLIILLGQNGFITNLLNLDGSIYGLSGILIGSVLYSFPVAFLMMFDVLRYEDCSSYQAADILGIPKFNQFTSITLPYLKKPLISIVFAVFTIIITDYGVPLIVGGNFRTLPVIMYEEVIGLLNFEKGSVIGLVLLLPALVAFIIDLLCKESGVHSFVVTKKSIEINKLRDFFTNIFCSVVCFLITLPILAFAMLSLMKKYPINTSFSFDNIARAFDMGTGRYLLNSILIAFFVSIIGTFVAYITAYLTARVDGFSSRALHMFSIVSMAIPGIVLGLAYALVYKGSFIYGTLTILVMVNLTHFFSSPYLMAYNSFHKLNKNLEAVGMTLGINRFYLLKDVFFPQMKSTIAEMLSYFFVNCMMTISAVSFLFTVNTMPLSMLITQFEAQMILECAAFVSIIILFVNVIVKIVFGKIRNLQLEKEIG